jgi:cytochrome P450
MDIFSDAHRRDPYPLYARIRKVGPVLRVPPPFDAWMVCDYDGVKRVLNDHDSFSSRVPAPDRWFLFQDPPRHTPFRALASGGFNHRMTCDLEPFVRVLSRSLLDNVLHRGELDVAGDFAIPLAMGVISRILGIPVADWPAVRAWSDTILKISYSRGNGDEARAVLGDFASATAAMSDYLTPLIAERRQQPRNDLLSQLATGDVCGLPLQQDDIVGFFQLLIVGGQETTANLICNALLSLLEHPHQLALLRRDMGLLPSAIEETLRYRSPVQWMMRTPTRELQFGGHTLAPGQLVLAVIGAANRDAAQFDRPDEFDIRRNPNPHLAFGRGIHLCVGAALARMEARIALGDLLERCPQLERAGDQPWEPRRALHVYGPSRLRVRFRAVRATRDAADGSR